MYIPGLKSLFGSSEKIDLRLVRIKRTETSTIGVLYINGVFECYILEDRDRGLKQFMTLDKIRQLKVYGKTAVPAGTYEVVITYSNKFRKYLPLLLDVPGYEGIRIHPGNTEVDTLGCLLPGTTYGDNIVYNSREAFNKLFDQLRSAVKKQKVFIEIV